MPCKISQPTPGLRPDGTPCIRQKVFFQTFCSVFALLFSPALTAVLAEVLLEVVTHFVADDGHDVFCRHLSTFVLELK